MDLLNQISSELKRGFSKSDLERLIGLPKNSLSGVLMGGKKLSKKSELKVQRFIASDKPDPLEMKLAIMKIERPKKAKGRLISEEELNNADLSQNKTQGKVKKQRGVVGSQKDLKAKISPLNAQIKDLGFNPDHYPDRKKGEGLLEYRIRMAEKTK